MNTEVNIALALAFMRPKWNMNFSGWPSSRSFFMRCASSPIASSQVIRFHLPSPRLPTRRSGNRIRSGSYTWLMPASPLAQSVPSVRIELYWGEIFTSSPSSTKPTIGQRVTHWMQALGIDFRSL